jgi:hypothetical protein
MMLAATTCSVQRLERALRGETWHGTVTGYTSHACRCDACRLAKAEAWAEYAKHKKGSAD